MKSYYNILRLYVGRSCFDCDMTYSIGVFYRNIPQPTMKYDKYPQFEDVLPLEQAYAIAKWCITFNYHRFAIYRKKQ